MKLVFSAIGLTLLVLAGDTQGRPQSKHGRVNIWNATDVSISDYPYMVSLFLEQMYFGAGVILNQHWIATSAFNVYEFRYDAIHLRVGSNFTDKGGQPLEVQQVVTPKQFTRTWDWDISLVKVTKKIKFNKNVKSIPLGTKNLTVGQKGVLTGWGPYSGEYIDSVNLQATNITVTQSSRCERVYASIFNDRLICTFDKHTGPADLDDAGDPLVVDGKLYGLYAGANDGYPIERPTLYTNVLKYRKWILKTIKT